MERRWRGIIIFVNVLIGLIVGIVLLLCVCFFALCFYYSRHLEAISSAENLPIRAEQSIGEMWRTIDEFIRGIRNKKENVFSIRFRAYAHNACADPMSLQANNVCKQLAGEVLLHLP